jgi:predicted dehydrogenase
LAGVCDTNVELVTRRQREWHVDFGATDPLSFVTDPRLDAVVIATPNDTHAPIAIAAAQAGKHVMCEKPLGLDAGQVEAMYRACRQNDVVHMTAFTYRFAPSMRYLAHLLQQGQLGEPRHFRSQRFLDLPETSWGWRQYKERAGAGDLFDMTIHRIDLGIWLLGPLRELTGAVARFAPRDRTNDGQSCRPSDVDDWSSLIGRFQSGAVGVWEGTTLAKGYGLNGFGHEWCEVNGSEGSAVYRLHRPNELWLGKTGSDLAPQPVPEEFLKPAGSPRDPSDGAPATVFRYDLMWEFVSAIVEGRDAVPSFYDGWVAQQVADAVLESSASGRWVSIPPAAK